MFFRKRKESRFDDLDPEQGPAAGTAIRGESARGTLIPEYEVATSRDGCRLILESCRFSRTFEGLDEDHPWAMSIDALKRAELEADWVMPPWFHRLEDAPPGEEHKAVALPAYRFDLELTSHDYVPEEDESCCGSRVHLVWFNDGAENWTTSFADAAKDDLVWKDVAGPAWREET